MNLYKYEIKEYNFMNIFRNIVILIIVKYLNIIFKFYILLNIYISKLVEEIRYWGILKKILDMIYIND